MISDYFSFSYESIKKRRLRSYLTMIGIFIGIAAVVSLISLGQGLQVAVQEQFQQAGSDKIFVTPGSGLGPPGSSAQKLTEHDKRIVERSRGVEGVSPLIIKFANVNFNDRTKFLPIHSISLEQEEFKIFEEAQNLKALKGRLIKQGDKNKVIVGYTHGTSDGTFGKRIDIRDKIFVEGEEFEVVGIADTTGSPPDDGSLYIPIETAQDIFGLKEEYDFIFVRVEHGADINAVAEAIKENMRQDRGVDEGEENFQVETLANLLETFGNIFNIVQAVIIGIAAISLLVGGIGIMNTMYMSVLERTKEIGVMKAIGAKNSDVMKIFLIESGFYGLMGGTIGILIGAGIAKLTEIIAGRYLGTGLLRAEITATLVGSVLVFAFLIGLFSGIAPAYRASKLNPVDALRYE